jgi:hypothetical protein
MRGISKEDPLRLRHPGQSSKYGEQQNQKSLWLQSLKMPQLGAGGRGIHRGLHGARSWNGQEN